MLCLLEMHKLITMTAQMLRNNIKMSSGYSRDLFSYVASGQVDGFSSSYGLGSGLHTHLHSGAHAEGTVVAIGQTMPGQRLNI